MTGQQPEDIKTNTRAHQRPKTRRCVLAAILPWKEVDHGSSVELHAEQVCSLGVAFICYVFLGEGLHKGWFPCVGMDTASFDDCARE